MPAIKTHKTSTTDKGWDGPAAEAKAKLDQSAAYYAKIYAWRDPNGEPGAKSTYKFPHHEVSSDGTPGAANIKGCQAVIGALNGARSRPKIPAGDRQGVWNHVAGHLRSAGEDPAELKAMNDFDIERRSYELVEVRVDRNGESRPRIQGLAAVFNEWTQIYPWFRERVAPGAFRRTIGEADVRALFNHSEDFVLGRTEADTLSLSEGETGLEVDISPPDTTWANDLLVSMERGDINQMSFAFRIISQEIDEDRERDLVSRTITEVELRDVSVVTFPAYPTTVAEVVRSLKPDFDFSAAEETFLRASCGLGLRDSDRTTLTRIGEFCRRVSEPGGIAGAEVHASGDAAAHSETSDPPVIADDAIRDVGAVEARLQLLKLSHF